MILERIILVVAGIAAAVALFLLVRPEDEQTALGTTPTRTTTPEPQVETVRISVRGGAPIGGVADAQVARGERVRIVVRADVADHVHLHGYDLTRDVAPGAPAQLIFTADVAGLFEIELEERSLLIGELEVRP